MSRKQYFINQYKFKNLKEHEEKLIFEETNKVSYSISENLLFKKLYEITGRTFIEKIEDKKAKPEDNPLEDLFILKASTVKKDEQDDLYERLIRDGCYINDIHYLYAEKSSSMIRTQKTVFIKEDVIKSLQEHLTLGKEPSKCVTAKWLTTKGYLLSSVDVVEIVPRICVIEDFNKPIINDVYIMEDYIPTDAEKSKYEEYLKEKKLHDEDYKKYIEELKKLKAIFKKEYFIEKFKNVKTIQNVNCKSINGWKQEHRRPMTEEIMNPIGYNEYQGTYYPVYLKSQTEEIKVFPIKPYSIGKDKNFYENNEVEINCFDGEGIGSFQFFERVRKALDIKHDINSIQMRLPCVKSNVVRVDWKKWFLDKGIIYITPISFNGEPVEPVSIMDIDIIMTESCFKAKLEKAEDKNGWLFENMQEYYSLLAKYQWNYMGITNYSHEHSDNKYNTLTYQFINSTELTNFDLGKLSLEELQMLKKVKQGDTAAVINFLNMIINKATLDENGEEIYIKEEEDLKDKAKVIMEAINLNERMVFDKEVQKFLFRRMENYHEDMLIGRILVPSQFLVATMDVIAFMEWAAYRDEEKVIGFLNKDEFYCAGKNEEHVMTRYPLCHFSEIKVAKFVNKQDNENYKWIKHLNNIIQFNANDLTMVRLNEDFDGDKNIILKANMEISKGKILKDAIVDDYIMFNPGDKATANSSAFDTDSIVKFEKLNMDNQTGVVTNYNTTYQTLAHSEGSLWKRNLESSMCKYLQGEIIDSVKKGNAVIIPDALKENAYQKPYFMKHKYGEDKSKKYLSPISPLDKFSKALEKLIKKQYPDDVKEELEVPEDRATYLDCGTIHKLMQCPCGNTQKELQLFAKLRDIFNDYSTKRGEIVKSARGLNRLSSKEEDKEAQKRIKEKYTELYTDTREKAVQACIEVYGELKENILASVAVDIEYVYAKDKNSNGIKQNRAYNFPWIASPKGILENVKLHKGAEKTKVSEIDEKDIEKLNAEGIKTYKVLDKFIRFETVMRDIKPKEIEAPVIKNNLIKIKDYQCNLMFCNGKEANEKLKKNNNRAKLKLKDGKYYSFFIGDELVASIAKQCLIYVPEDNNGQGFKLQDYEGKEFNIKVITVNDKSLITNISYAAEQKIA